MSDATQAADFGTDWAVLARPRAGEMVCGDVGLVRLEAGGALLAAIDGLGHGDKAAAAAATAAHVISGFDDHDIASVMDRCHRALRGTRGAAISIAWLSFGARTMTWAAVGDVEGRLIAARRGRRPDRSLRVPGGVAGFDRPALTLETVDFEPGDVVVLASDGVDGGFADALRLSGPVRDIAAQILVRYWDGGDDGLAVVFRCPPVGARTSG